MSQQDLLKHVVAALDHAGIEYMITGSIASSIQGEPRLTHDIDVVVAIEPSQVAALLEAFPQPRFYVSETAVADALRTGGMFNVIEAAEGDKVDFWMLTDDPFDRSRFGRRCDVRVFGTSVRVTSPEDTILAKLRWAKLSDGSEKMVQDAVRVYEVQLGTLDLTYLEDWSERLNVTDLWRHVVGQAGAT